MKINLADLKKAIQWVETNSRDVTIDVFAVEGTRRVTINCMDKYENEVEITIHAEGQMLPKIKKTEAL